MDQKTPPTHTPMPAMARRLRNLFFAALGLLVLLNGFIRPHHPHFGLEAIPGFWGLFGLAGAVILGKGAKGLAHTVLGKDENFYEKGFEDSRGQGAK
jgi:hypothetical protein